MTNDDQLISTAKRFMATHPVNQMGTKELPTFLQAALTILEAEIGPVDDADLAELQAKITIPYKINTEGPTR